MRIERFMYTSQSLSQEIRVKVAIPSAAVNITDPGPRCVRLPAPSSGWGHPVGGECVGYSIANP